MLSSNKDSRAGKKTLQRQLEELVIDSIVEDDKVHTTWVKSGYDFRFITRKYFWNKEEIHITAGEAIFLFRWLVLGVVPDSRQQWSLRNLRKRHGKDFLSEVVERAHDEVR
jgi:hypothetical protein